MEDALASVRPDIPDEPVAALTQSFVAGDAIGRVDERMQQRAVFRRWRVDAADMATRHDEDVRGRGWMPVSKGDDRFVCVDLRAGERACNDAAEEARGIKLIVVVALVVGFHRMVAHLPTHTEE